MSFGIKVGRAIGVVGALAVEGVVRGATATGGFAVDVMEGAEVGYAEKHAALLVTRAEGEARRKALLEAKRAEHKARMAAAPEGEAAAPITAKRTAKAV